MMLADFDSLKIGGAYRVLARIAWKLRGIAVGTKIRSLRNFALTPREHAAVGKKISTGELVGIFSWWGMVDHVPIGLPS